MVIQGVMKQQAPKHSVPQAALVCTFLCMRVENSVILGLKRLQHWLYSDTCKPSIATSFSMYVLFLLLSVLPQNHGGFFIYEVSHLLLELLNYKYSAEKSVQKQMRKTT